MMEKQGIHLAPMGGILQWQVIFPKALDTGNHSGILSSFSFTHAKHVYIPVGCVLPAWWPYPIPYLSVWLEGEGKSNYQSLSVIICLTRERGSALPVAGTVGLPYLEGSTLPVRGSPLMQTLQGRALQGDRTPQEADLPRKADPLPGGRPSQEDEPAPLWTEWQTV